eukprot:SAG31_NODE_23615_length_500_cov_1.246883_1_plen_28_part_01
MARLGRSLRLIDGFRDEPYLTRGGSSRE